MMPEAMFKMRFIAMPGPKAPDGLPTVHVQNFIGIYKGQHHIHSLQGYNEWLKLTDPDNTADIATASRLH